MAIEVEVEVRTEIEEEEMMKGAEDTIEKDLTQGKKSEAEESIEIIGKKTKNQ